MAEETGGRGNEQPKRWDYDTHFREYALLIGRKGTEGLEYFKNYPERIQLGDVWHGALDRMRIATKGDGHERYALIAYDDTARDFQFPEISAKGEPREVPPKVIFEEIRKAKEERKITTIIGDLHTHPLDRPFSTGDLSNLLHSQLSSPTLFSGVTTDRLNIFAFQTKETEMITKFEVTSDAFQTFFKKYWFEKAGYKLKNDGSEIINASLTANLWKVNFGIAEKHRLVLYKGKPKEDLVRIHTDKTQLWIWSDIVGDILKG